MKKVPGMVLVLLVLLTLSACSPVNSPTATPASKQPTVIHHPAPDLKVDTGWIKEAGCIPGEYNSMPCSADSPLRKLGCDEIRVVDLFGGLSHPVVLCQNYSQEKSLQAEFSPKGCYLSSHDEALLMSRDGAYQLVGKKEIRSVSVPIDSPEEALSYVMLTTDYFPMYGIEIGEYNYYLVDEIEDTYVQETRGGYLLHLFHNLDPVCSCAQHYTDVVEVLVSRDGDIHEISSRHFLYLDACID